MIPTTKPERQKILFDNPGLIARVAETTGFTPATVSRTFHGKFSRPNKRIVAALVAEIERAREVCNV